MRTRFERAAARSAALVGATLALAAASPLSGQSITGEVATETRAFANTPLYEGQERHDASFVIAPELYVRAGPGGVVFEPFGRLDASDEQRSHFDLRALAWEGGIGDWEITAGLSRVFWGVTESQHLVDIVNQTDLVENPDGEDKLGQPMVKLGRVTRFGLLEAFVLPGFRERTFPGEGGRIRTPVPVDVDRPIYESGQENRHVDFAARWSNYFGPVDIGVSWFRGTNREPRLVPEQNGEVFALRPAYDIAQQFAVDAQWTRDAWLWKVEGITRDTDAQGRFYAFTGGFEYTLFQIAGSDADLGLITEYLHDSRGAFATTAFEDDVFAGGRLALNDVAGTELLFGGIVDVDTGGTFLNVEGSRRLSNYWTIDVEMRSFLGVDDTDFLYSIRDDDHLLIALRRFF